MAWRFGLPFGLSQLFWIMEEDMVEKQNVTWYHMEGNMAFWA